MNILLISFAFLLLLSLAFAIYFLIRFLIAKMNAQPESDYLKKLVVSTIILAVALIGIFMVPKSSEDAALSEQQDAKEKISANKKDVPEEVPSEEKSADETTAAEMKAKKEADKKSEREAKQREQNLSKTLRVTPADFHSRILNDINSAGYNFVLGKPQITESGKTERHAYRFDDSVGMSELIDKNTGNVKEVNVMLFEISREDIAAALTTYVAAIKAVNPDLSVDDLNYIENELGLGSEIMKNLVRNKSTVFNGKKYSHRLIEASGVVFSINIP